MRNFLISCLLLPLALAAGARAANERSGISSAVPAVPAAASRSAASAGGSSVYEYSSVPSAVPAAASRSAASAGGSSVYEYSSVPSRQDAPLPVLDTSLAAALEVSDLTDPGVTPAALSAADSFRTAASRSVPSLDFARLDRNRILFQTDSPAFGRVFSKLDSLRCGDSCDLRIMYIGGSHVQAGTLTGQLRENLLSLGDSLDGGRGLVFPFWAARTNTPSSFRTRCQGEWVAAKNTQKDPRKRLGLTGMAISTSDSTAFVRIVTHPRKPFHEGRTFPFNKVRVLGYSSRSDRRPVLILDSGDTLRCAPAQTDSCFTFDLPSYQDSVTIAVEGTAGEFTLTGIYLDRPEPGITLTEIGVNGAALTSYARCPDLERDLGLVDPDLVIFGVGINDASGTSFSEEMFIQRYHSLVRKVLAVNPSCALLFVTNNDSFRRSRKRGYYVNTNGTLAENAFLRLGKVYGAGVWDLFDIMGGLKSMQRWESAGLAKRDKVHFTDEGYQLLGDLLFNALVDSYSEHLKQLE